MNHLAHFALARSDPQLMIGSFLGDYVKGRLNGEHPPAIERGIRLHRAVDAFTDSHETVRQSRRRFAKPYSRFAGIMTDVIFDHFLANFWEEYNSDKLDTFSRFALTTLLENRDLMPVPAALAAKRMRSNNSLAGYGREEFISNALTHIGTRLKRANPLEYGYEEFDNHRIGLLEDFQDFYPELQRFADTWLREH